MSLDLTLKTEINVYFFLLVKKECRGCRMVLFGCCLLPSNVLGTKHESYNLRWEILEKQ